MIEAGAMVVGAGINALSQARQNKKSREFSLDMYERQKADNLNFWNMENEYNSPQAQMKRLKDAGLNPNLVYGASAPSGHGGNISTADAHKPEFEAPRYGDALIHVGSYLDYEMKQAQIDLVNQDAALRKEQTILNMLEQHGKGYDNNMKMVESQNKAWLQDTHIEYAKEQLRKLRADTQYTLDSNERAQAMLEPNIQNAVEDILTKRLGRQVSAQQLKNLQLEEEVQKFRARMAQQDMNPNDPLYARALGFLIGTLIEKIKGYNNKNTLLDAAKAGGIGNYKKKN